MFSWTELQQYNFESPPSIQFKRKSNIEVDYQKHLTILKRQEINVSDYIKSKAFPNNEKYTFLKNNFPYDIEDGIEHWLLWLNPDFKISDLDIKKIVEEKMGTNSVYFCNIKANQSIPSIRHCHIFSKL